MSVEVSSRKRRLAIAYVIAQEQKTLKCPDCLISFESIPALFQHLRKPHMENRERYSHLNDDFESEIEDEYQEAEIKPDDKSPTCKICRYKLPKLGSTLIFHINSWHKGGRTACPKCGIKFNKQWQLAVHLNNQHGIEIQLDCKKCRTKHSHYKISENGKYYSYHQNAE